MPVCCIVNCTGCAILHLLACPLPSRPCRQLVWRPAMSSRFLGLVLLLLHLGTLASVADARLARGKTFGASLVGVTDGDSITARVCGLPVGEWLRRELPQPAWRVVTVDGASRAPGGGEGADQARARRLQPPPAAQLTGVRGPARVRGSLCCLGFGRHAPAAQRIPSCLRR